ncbi:hypothetical protein ACFL1X_14355 [Candidatus Hydrogenedentota bacterium]
MKTTAWVVMSVCCVFLCGCGLEALFTAGVVGGLAAEQAKQAQGVMRPLSNQMGIQALQNTINQFMLIEGRFPHTLDELKTKGYLPNKPAAPEGYTLSYDPKNGLVSLVEGAAPAIQAPQNQQQYAPQYPQQKQKLPFAAPRQAPKYQSRSPKPQSGSHTGQPSAGQQSAPAPQQQGPYHVTPRSMAQGISKQMQNKQYNIP